MVILTATNQLMYHADNMIVEFLTKVYRLQVAG